MSAYEPPTEILSSFNASLFPLKNAPQNEYVDLVSPQLIDGVKEFDDNIVANITGNAATVTGISNVGSGSVITGTERTKLTGIEVNADVTDATNVLAAGAVMTTGTQNNIAGVKTFTSTIVGSVNGNAGTVTGVVASSKVSVGTDAGATNMSNFATALGSGAGQTNMATAATACGRQALQTNGGDSATAIGISAGQISAGANSFCGGNQAGLTSVGANCVCVGAFSGQGVAVGTDTAVSLLANSVAIGRQAAYHGSSAKCVVLNGTGAPLPSTVIGAESFYVKPVRGVAHGKGAGVMVYEASTGEITYSTNYLSHMHANCTSHKHVYIPCITTMSRVCCRWEAPTYVCMYIYIYIYIYIYTYIHTYIFIYYY